ncbi:MAG: DUF4870 domain-containing protein [Acidobacteriota bacterium]
MVCHIISLVGLMGNGIGFFLGPLIVWLIKREDHPFIDRQGKEAVNFQLTMILAFLVSAILCLVVIGFLFIFILAVLIIVLPIIAAVKANEGKEFEYPFAIRFIR